MDASLPRQRCYGCRQVRLKCNHRRPTCGRCEKAGIKCEYPDPRFKSMNYASKARVAARSPRPMESTDSESSEPSYTPAASPSASRMVDFNPPFAPPVRDNWTQTAISYFFSAFVVNTPNPSLVDGHLLFLPIVCRRHADDPLLQEALSAVSLSAFSKISAVPEMAIRARESYGNALKLTIKAMNESKKVRNEQIMTTLLLLSFHEILNGDEPTTDISHIRAHDHVIGPQWLPGEVTAAGLELYRISASRQQMMTLIEKTPPRPFAEDELRTLSPAFLETKSRDFLYAVNDMCHTGLGLLQEAKTYPSNQRTIDSLREIIRASTELDTQALEWEFTAREHPEYGVITYPKSTFNPNDQNRPKFVTDLHAFHHLCYAKFWLQFWSGRAFLVQLTHDCIAHLESMNIPTLHCHCIQHVDQSLGDVTDKILGSVAYFLGEIGTDGKLREGSQAPNFAAIMGAVALRATSLIRPRKEGQFEWICDRLLAIGKDWSLEKALVFRNVIMNEG